MKKLTGTILLIGSSADASDIRYASGFAPVDPVVFLEHRKRRYLVVPVLERGRAVQTTHRVEVVTPAELPIPRAQQRRLSGWAAGIMKKAGARQATVSPFFPLGVARRLARSGLSLRVASGALYPRRAVKTGEEIARIREVQQAAAQAMREAFTMIAAAEISPAGYLKNGRRRLTAEDVRYRIDTALLQRNALARDTIVACGEQAVDPHERGHGPLQAGRPIVIDIFPQHRVHGYWGDITRTVARGPVSPEVRRMYRAVMAAQQAALRCLKPGVSGSRVHQTAERVLREHGFKTTVGQGVAEGFIHGTGHGVGLDIHEAPSLGLSKGRLKAGHVVTVEPGLYYPRWGGIRVEDTVLVTRGGWRYLAACPKRFLI